MEDITYRAVRVLGEVDVVACEDTRRTGKILAAYGINAKLTSYHSYNLRKKTPILLERLENGGDVALVSDSGTPGISDPGRVIIKEAVERDLPVTHVPGASALITALLLSGKPSSKFVFEGFLSSKRSRRKKALETLKEEKRTVVVYESPHRLVAFLEDLLEVLGDIDVSVARELTKKFEEVRREKVSEQIRHFSGKKPKGEFVIVF